MVDQKQKQKQSVSVNVNVGHARLRRKTRRRVRGQRVNKKAVPIATANYFYQPLTRMIRQDVPTAVPYSVFNPMMAPQVAEPRIKVDVPVSTPEINRARQEAAYTDGYASPGMVGETMRDIFSNQNLGSAFNREPMSARKYIGPPPTPFGGLGLRGAAKANPSDEITPVVNFKDLMRQGGKFSRTNAAF
jgi:hypothetical protein